MLNKSSWIWIAIIVILVFVGLYKDDRLKESETKLKKSETSISLLNQQISSYTDSVSEIRRYYSNEMSRMHLSVVDSMIEEIMNPDGTYVRKIHISHIKKDTMYVSIHDTVTNTVELLKRDTIKLTETKIVEKTVDSSSKEVILPPASKLYVGVGYQLEMDIDNTPFVEATYVKPMGIFFISGGVHVPYVDVTSNARVQAQVGIQF